jgi:hypothetical protein
VASPIPELPDEADTAGLFYRHTDGWNYSNLAIDPHDTITDPQERAYCRALLLRALALLDADSEATAS